MENTTKGADEWQKNELEKQNQCVSAMQERNNEVKELGHKCSDLLGLRLQRVEESARSWVVLSKNLASLQSEFTVMKSTQMELLTTIQHVDNMLQKLVFRHEQDEPVGGKGGTLSQIAEE